MNENTTQLELFEVQVQKDIQGIEMGVLENGIAYLTQRGLAKLCGVRHSVIYDITKEWEEHYDETVISKSRFSFIQDYLSQHGYRERKLYLDAKQANQDVYAYPDLVCMAILEFYAFESTGPSRDIAIQSYRVLTRYGLQEYIYRFVGYAPENKWKHHIDRVSILKNRTPDGYFSIFQEIAGMVVDLIDAGLSVNEKTVPDISVGKTWAAVWTDRDYNNEYGDRIPYKHDYPEYFPQAGSNPQQALAYPDSALPIFRKWFKEEYLTRKFPNYILRKASLLKGGRTEADKMIAIFAPIQIEES